VLELAELGRLLLWVPEHVPKYHWPMMSQLSAMTRGYQMQR
jgi:hypothetical protein